MRQIKTGDRLRYAFDKSMSRGAIALIGYLGVASFGLIFLAALVVVILHIAPGGADHPHILLDGPFRQADAELTQFCLNAFGTP